MIKKVIIITNKLVIVEFESIKITSINIIFKLSIRKRSKVFYIRKF